MNQPLDHRVLVFGEALPLRPALRVAACAGAEVLTEADPSRVVPQVAAFQPRTVLFHVDHGGPAALLLLRRIHQVCPDADLILMAHPSPPENMRALLDEPWFSHLLALDSPWLMADLGATLAKLHGADPFGLTCYLPWGTRVVTHRVTGSADKAHVFDRIEEFMGAMGIGGRIVRHLHAIADELLMNAIYDAPLDAQGQPRYAARPRGEVVKLEPHEQPTIRFGSDGRRFGISISDPFGGLTPELLRRYISKGLRRESDQIDTKPGGAGLGLYMLFSSLHTLCLNLSPGRCTEMVGLVNIQGSFRDLALTPRSLNIFVR